MDTQPDDFTSSTDAATVQCRLNWRRTKSAFWILTVRSGINPMARTVELTLEQAIAVREALYELERRMEQAAEHAEDLARAGML